MMDGYIICNLHDGAVNAECFLAFIEEVLPLCTSFPGLRSIIIIDNASIHWANVCPLSYDTEKLNTNATLGNLWNYRGMWIPTRIPSSLFSQLHPIEFSLSVIKSALRESYQLQGNENIEELAEKVKNTVNKRVTPFIARSQFCHCTVIFE